MGRTKRSESDAKGIPSRLQEALDRAEANAKPDGNCSDAEALPGLFELLCPAKVDVPKEGNPEELKKALRQPMLMLFWDAGNGAWNVTVSDKVLKVKIGALVPSLAGALADFEGLLANGKASYKSLE